MLTKPFVSVLTPTYNRRVFFKQYLRNIKRQDYGGRIEVLIADDGNDEIKDLIPRDPMFRYIRLDNKKSIGYKRNLLCQEAKGDILIHMDDDDFYPSERISHAVHQLNNSTDAHLAGCSQLFIYSKRTGIRELPPMGCLHATAGTFAYSKAYSEINMFDESVDFGEELSFTHHYTNALVQLNTFKTILVVAHESNTYSKNNLTTQKTKLKLNDFVKIKKELIFYQGLV